MIFAKQFDQITKADVDELVSNQVSEGRELDYKEKLPGGAMDEKREYLYDLTSFANTSGGVMIFGIQEQRDGKNNPTGLPADASGLSDINADKEIQRLESFQLAGVERRVPGVRFHPIEGFPNGPVILVYVPKSWAAPHIVTLGGIHRFYARGERGKYLMDWHQIRSSFLFSESIAERIRNFRYERVARIGAEDVPAALKGNARAILHIVPISAFEPTSNVDVLTLRNNLNWLRPPGWESSSGWSNRTNFDGFLRWIDQTSYVQLFRTGAIEAVEAHLLNWQGGCVPWPAVEKQIVDLCRDYITTLPQLGIEPPLICALTLLRVKDFRIVRERETGFPIGRGIDRDDLLLPETVADSFPVDVPTLLRPVFDTLWQSAGSDRSQSYDAQGKYILDEKR
jgi:Putative DNA-binding domain